MINIGLLKFLIAGSGFGSEKATSVWTVLLNVDGVVADWLTGYTFHFSCHWKTTEGTERNCLSVAAFMNQHIALLSSHSPSLFYHSLSLLLDNTISTHSTGV